jgi:hypothetical protein
MNDSTDGLRSVEALLAFALRRPTALDACLSEYAAGR